MRQPKFKPWTVDVRGLSRKEAAKKRRFAKERFKTFLDLKETIAVDMSREKCRYKVHTSRAYVRENINSI